MVIVTKCWQSAVLQYLCLRIIQEAKSQLRLGTGLYTRLYLWPMHWAFHCQCQCQVSTRSLQVWLGLVWQWQVDRIIQVVDIKQSYVCSVQIIFLLKYFLGVNKYFRGFNIFLNEYFLTWIFGLSSFEARISFVLLDVEDSLIHHEEPLGISDSDSCCSESCGEYQMLSVCINRRPTEANWHLVKRQVLSRQIRR